jgi:hypothetical protein
MAMLGRHTIRNNTVAPLTPLPHMPAHMPARLPQDLVVAGTLFIWSIMYFDDALRAQHPRLTALLTAVYSHPTTLAVTKVRVSGAGGWVEMWPGIEACSGDVAGG